MHGRQNPKFTPGLAKSRWRGVLMLVNKRSMSLVSAVCCTIVTLALVTTATAEVTEGHAREQIARLHKIKTLVGGGDVESARRMVDAARGEERTFAATDPRGIDADEMQVALLAAQESYVAAWIVSQKAIAARRLTQPREPMLLGWSLFEHSLIAERVGQLEVSERSVSEALQQSLLAYPTGDVRQAKLLETYADMFDRGYNRPMAALRLYEAAVAIREGLGSPSRDLAATLSNLATMESISGRDPDADRHLTHAGVILKDMAANSADPASKADMLGDEAMTFGRRAKIAIRAERYDEALEFVEVARREAKETRLATLVEIIAADIFRQERTARGDLDAALTATHQTIELMQRTKWSPVQTAQLQLSLAHLQVEQTQYDAAEATLTGALKALTDAPTSEGAKIAEGWLLLADIKRARGNKAGADELTTGALSMLKSRRSEMAVLFGTNRNFDSKAPGQFGTKRATELTFGEALVFVPGAIPSTDGGIVTMGAPSPLEKLIVANAHVLDSKAFATVAAARTKTAKLYPKSALVFVHGFGTTFEFALARAGQISRDIAYDGPVFAFSWPSLGNTLPTSYGTDQTTATASRDALVRFLGAVEDATGADRIHIVAHSMGNLVLIDALSDLQRSAVASAGLAAKLGEILFASPDVDAADFKAKVGALQGRHLTLYASANDSPLRLSAWKHLGPRAGSVIGGRPVLAPGLDSIDVTAAGSDWFGNHELYISNPFIATDLRKLLEFNVRPPTARSKAIVESGKPTERYWVFVPPAAHATPH